MTKSPRLPLRECAIIVAERKEDHPGSKWDWKPFGRTGMPLIDLRYKAGEMVVVYGWKERDVAGQLGVSLGFVSKWKRIFEARYRINQRYARISIHKNVFRSLSNRPKNCSCPIRDSIRRAVVILRRKYSFMGAAKIKAALKLDVSSATINKVLREEGCLGDPVTRRRGKTFGRFERPQSLDLVQLDYKTWADGVHSIWILDDCSRYILGYRIDERQSADNVIELLDRIFPMWGLYPRQILTDHGSEFYSIMGGKGASKLDKWCLDHGIEHITGRVRHPQTQGKIERSHGSATSEMCCFGSTETLAEARESIPSWIEFYNYERPHQAIGYRTPFEHFIARISEDDIKVFLRE